MRSRLLIALALVFAAVLGPAAAAHAQCGPTEDVATHLARADAAFIGKVVDRSNRDRTAVMEVLEVWKGPRLPATVTVKGGPEDVGQFTAVDRHYLLGQIYLVMPANSSPPFLDSLCTGTQLWTTPNGEIPRELQLAAGNIAPLAPLAATDTAGGPAGTSNLLRNAVVAAGALVLAFGIVWVLRRAGARRRQRRRAASGAGPEPLSVAAFRRRGPTSWLRRFSLLGFFESRRGSRLEQVRRSTRRGKGTGDHAKEQLERAVKLTATKPPSRRNHYTSGRRSAP